MSKGNPNVIVRFPRYLLAQVDETCHRLNVTSAASPPDRSEFIRKAVREKLDHYRRSAAPRRRAPRRRGAMHPDCRGLSSSVYFGGAGA